MNDPTQMEDNAFLSALEFLQNHAQSSKTQPGTNLGNMNANQPQKQQQQQMSINGYTPNLLPGKGQAQPRLVPNRPLQQKQNPSLFMDPLELQKLQKNSQLNTQMNQQAQMELLNRAQMFQQNNSSAGGNSMGFLDQNTLASGMLDWRMTLTKNERIAAIMQL